MHSNTHSVYIKLKTVYLYIILNMPQLLHNIKPIKIK